MNKILTAAITTSLLFSAASMAAMKSDSVMVGGAAMYPSKNIVENALNSKDHTTLVAAVKAAGLVETRPLFWCRISPVVRQNLHRWWY